MNRNIYKVDWPVVLRWMVPFEIRLVPLVQWVKALCSPVIKLYNEFIAYKNEKDYDLEITGQVCRLERMLNDKYDSRLRRIFITDGGGAEALWLYTDAELQPLIVYDDFEEFIDAGEREPDLYLYTDGEVDGDLVNDFVINIPISISFNRDELIGKVKRKRLPGMRFDIQLF
jgi:hypothetical protein